MKILSNLKCIDSHSHFSIIEGTDKVGIEYYFPKEGSFEEYKKMAINNNVVEAMLMPCPTPKIIRDNGKVVDVPITWKEINGRIIYFSSRLENGKEHICKPKQNPYSEINFRLHNFLLKQQSEKIKFNYIPLVNLVFDTVEYLQELIRLKPRAIKVHGVGLGLDDFSKINENLLKIIAANNIPLIIHTDYFDGNPVNKLEEVHKMNDPLNWIRLCEKYQIRALLTHGIRLCNESADIIKNSDLFYVGIAPDLLLQSEQQRLKRKGSYLENLLELIRIDQLVFDMDFPWNIIDRVSYEKDEYLLTRLQKCMTASDLYKVVNKNPTNFFC